MDGAATVDMMVNKQKLADGAENQLIIHKSLAFMTLSISNG